MRFLIALLPLCIPSILFAQALPGTKPLDKQGDLAKEMVAGIDRYLMRELDRAVANRAKFFAGTGDQAKKAGRAHLARILGVVDDRVKSVDVQTFGSGLVPKSLESNNRFKAFHIRWPVLPGVDAEGIVLEPVDKPRACVIALPDADWTPEMFAGLQDGVPFASQAARALAGNGCRVLIPTLIDRRDTWSGNPRVGRLTNQPHREFVYRMAYQMGRHVIGYEVQKVMAAVDWAANDKAKLPIGVIGYGEGGLVAFYSAALDERIQATVVSGYFGPRENLWREPIYRNVWNLLPAFGDAEIAGLIAPRDLLLEYHAGPKVAGPPLSKNGRGGAAPGKLLPLLADDFRTEVRRLANPFPITIQLTPNAEPVAMGVLQSFLTKLLPKNPVAPWVLAAKKQIVLGTNAKEAIDARQERQIAQLTGYTQKLLPLGEQRRKEFFWSKLDLSSVEKFKASQKPLRADLWEESLGKLPAPNLPPNARTRLIYDTPKFKGYEVVLDLYEDVFCHGILLVPNDIKPGEKRPVVVCQHGLEGRPTDVCNPKEKTKYYQSFGAQLAARGYIVFAPQAPYIGQDAFRVLQRKANPLKLTIYAFIARQHERILDWLTTLPFVDPARIAYYGLSYGGKVAMRIGALLERYCLVICSGDFNEWIWKNITLDWAGSYVFSGEYEMFEWNLGNTFNYAEMAALISPRPFMVERGHDDGVGLDEYVAHEYAKVRRHYARLKLPERTEIEFFSGGHVIHGQGTFAFLDRHLHWRAR